MMTERVGFCPGFLSLLLDEGVEVEVIRAAAAAPARISGAESIGAPHCTTHTYPHILSLFHFARPSSVNPRIQP